jgi:hypothetical protein
MRDVMLIVGMVALGMLAGRSLQRPAMAQPMPPGNAGVSGASNRFGAANLTPGQTTSPHEHLFGEQYKLYRAQGGTELSPEEYIAMSSYTSDNYY